MHKEIETAVNNIFAEYNKDARLESIKAELVSALNDTYTALRQKGIVEHAAVKRVLSDLDKATANAESAASGSKQKRLEHLAKHFGISPIGSSLALARIGFGLLAACGVLAALAFWLTRQNLAGAVAALTPFAAIAFAGFTLLELKRYRADKAETATAKALLAALISGVLTAFLLAQLAAALA